MNVVAVGDQDDYKIDEKGISCILQFVLLNIVGRGLSLTDLNTNGDQSQIFITFICCKRSPKRQLMIINIGEYDQSKLVFPHLKYKLRMSNTNLR